MALGVEAIVVAATVVNITVTFGNALVRFVFNQDFPWSADVWALLISIIAFLGAPAYFRRGHGMAYTALIDSLSGARRDTVQACGLFLLLGVCLAALLPFPQFFAAQQGQSLPILGIDSGFVAIWLGIGLALMAVFTAEKLMPLSARPRAIGAAVALALAVAAWLLRAAYDAGTIEFDPFIAIVPALALAFVTGVPIGGILALGGILYFLITGDAPMVIVPSALQYGIHSYILLAIPFFMLAGTLMEITGMAKRMVDMVQAAC